MDDIVTCDQCHRSVKMRDILTVIDKRDSHRVKRLCRDCQCDFYINEARGRGMKVAVWGKFSEDEIKRGEDRHVKWSKEVKEGK